MQYVMGMMHTFIYILLCLYTLLSYFNPKKQKRKTNEKAKKLPPGSMGWPYIGETLQLYSQDPNDFFAKKQRRYGDIFKTHILGCPCVMLASPEAARFVLVTRAYLFKPTYPKSKETMIGSSALFFHQGDYHNHLRKLVQSSLSPEAIRKLIPDIEDVGISALESWASEQVINTFHEMKKFSFEVGILSVFGHLDEKYREELKENYCVVDKGYNSFPTSLPGTAYHKANLVRKRLGQTLTESQITDNIIGVLFAAQDTTASVLTWILKYLHDDQKLLEAVKEEQKAINESNGGGKKPLTWAQTRNMPVTYKVIMESLRMASIISFTFREAVVDVEYEGYLIPKGWKVTPLFRNIHPNPEFFPDPKHFDPSRFEVHDNCTAKVAPKPNTFMPFGNGVHACPGNELAKLEMLILVHHLVTKFRWEVVGSQSGIEYGPFPVPLKGLPAKFGKESSTQEVFI
ncbi:Abscisic acid 8'-hydroxylase [Actinidia chinensis var. chinensis]|uniref:Abscisic acid 8'-hydroxylase n=1 Tax=Actinidia chinensis var. chinensis TaxID=1590841 RepID=A0A2R6Q6D7_ACTCC|nr:Abscisic acid 8'-hydroxylase [Actinidia chinensis var. chinensis]